jgi:hypothetical protein
MSFEKFLSHVRTKSLSRQNRFEVIIPFGDSQLTSLMCHSVTLPSQFVVTDTNNMFGISRDHAWMKNVNQIVMRFYMDTDLKVKKIFDDWLKQIHNPDNGILDYYNNYIRDITIKVLDINDNVRNEIQVYEAYPRNVEGDTMEARANGIATLAVTFNFRYYRNKK